MACIEIETADNGFVLEYDDPEIVSSNASSDSWTDPTRQRVYATAEALMADLKTLLPLMKAQDDEKDQASQYKSALNEVFAKGTGN